MSRPKPITLLDNLTYPEASNHISRILREERTAFFREKSIELQAAHGPIRHSNFFLRYERPVVELFIEKHDGDTRLTLVA